MLSRPVSCNLVSPDLEMWHRQYPDGVGPSAFSAPGWQQLMASEEGPPWSQRVLRVESAGKGLSIPVLARRARLGRWILMTQPIAYYVTPIEKGVVEPQDLELLLCALRFRPTIAWFQLWLAPWSLARPSSQHRGFGHLGVREVETFVIRLDKDVDYHLQEQLGRARQRGIRANERERVSVVDDPSPQQRDAYYRLYCDAHQERDWVGKLFSRDFFEGVATRLGRGGKLCVVLHGDRVMGGGVLLYDRCAVHYFQGAVDRSIPEVSPHDALYLFTLREAERRGLRWVNLGGINPGNQSLVRFKQSWGATAEISWALRWACGPRVFAARALRWPRRS